MMTLAWDIPASWVMTTLGEACLINPRFFTEPVGDDLELSFLPMSAVEAGTARIDLSRVRPYGDISKGYTRFSEGDVLFAKITPCMENGKIAIARGLSNGAGCGSTEFHVLRPWDGLSRDYLMYYLFQDEFRKDAQRNMAGTAGQLRVPAMFMSNSNIPLPPLPEQRRIVAEIEKQFTRLDASVAALKRVQANLKRYRASVLKAACEGKLVPTEAVLARADGRDYEPADQLLERILSERRALWEAQEKRARKYKEPVVLDNTGLPALPEGWSYVQIEQILSLNRSGLKTGPFGSLLKKHEHKKNGVPVLGIENIQRMEFVRGSKIFVTPQKAQELSSYDVQEGDILISRSGTVGEACVLPAGIGDARLSTNLMRMTLAKEFVSPRYFCLLFNGSPTVLDQVSELCSGSTRDFLNGKILRSMVFPLPPSAEQHRIVAEVERRLSVIQQAEVAVQANLTRAERLRQSILKRAFEGKLVPQDSNDQPASVLLERIRVEREASHADAKNSRQTRPRRGKSPSARQLVLREGSS